MRLAGISYDLTDELYEEWKQKINKMITLKMQMDKPIEKALAHIQTLYQVMEMDGFKLPKLDSPAVVNKFIINMEKSFSVYENSYKKYLEKKEVFDEAWANYYDKITQREVAKVFKALDIEMGEQLMMSYLMATGAVELEGEGFLLEMKEKYEDLDKTAKVKVGAERGKAIVAAIKCALAKNKAIADCERLNDDVVMAADILAERANSLKNLEEYKKTMLEMYDDLTKDDMGKEK